MIINEGLSWSCFVFISFFLLMFIMFLMWFQFSYLLTLSNVLLCRYNVGIWCHYYCKSLFVVDLFLFFLFCSNAFSQTSL